MRRSIRSILMIGGFCLISACVGTPPALSTPVNPATPVVPTVVEPTATTVPNLYLPFSTLFGAPNEVDPVVFQDGYEQKSPFPSSPETLTLYRQGPNQPPFSAEAAKGVALLFGVKGSPTSYPGEAGGTVYQMSDGAGEISVFSVDPLAFTYDTDGKPITGNPDKLYSFAQRGQAAVDFLKAHHLLDFDYSLGPVTNSNWADFSVAIAPFLNGYPLYENDPTNPRIQVSVDAEDKVHIVMYQTLAFTPLSAVKIRSAKEVWADFLGGKLNGRSYAHWLYLPGNETKTPSAQLALEHIGLVYYAEDFRHQSGNVGYPIDGPVNSVIPIWQYICRTRDGNTFEVLAEAIQP